MRIFTSLADILPAKLVYMCAIRVWAETTINEYGSTDPSTITMSECIRRFARIYKIAGHGSDEFHDSNK